MTEGRPLGKTIYKTIRMHYIDYTCDLKFVQEGRHGEVAPLLCSIAVASWNAA
jgi:hypothetical protein